MTEWSRSSPWRQGSILDHELVAVFARSFGDPPTEADFAIVVSHDCDIAASPTSEPYIEVISGTFVPEQNGSLTHAKDARRLHLSIMRADQPQFAELKATNKFQISKEQFAGKQPSSKLVVGSKDLGILRRWLAARYRRHAFPDKFEERFDRVEPKFRDILKRSNTHLRAILFDLEDPSSDSADPDAPYILDIYLIYTGGSDFTEALKVAQSTKSKIEKAFQGRYQHNGEWKDIELRNCDVMSDEALSYFQYLQLAEWRSEGLSLRSDPFEPMTEENS
jgi:hypothetical protein